MMKEPDSRFLEARIEDMYRQCERNYSPVYSAFLDERQCAEAEIVCSRQRSEMKYALWGGYENARRKILCVYDEYSADSFMENMPFRCLTFNFRKEDRLSHRDFLGAFMSLMLKREAIGDIVIAEGKAQAFAADAAAQVILSSIGKIGRIGVKVSGDEPFCLEIKQEFQEICVTVASLRLDCVAAAAARLSREKAAGLIRTEKISVNHLPEKSVSREIHEGDVISIRGTGRFILGKINGITKKGRIHIELRKYK